MGSTLVLLITVIFFAKDVLISTTKNQLLAIGQFEFLKIRSFAFISAIISLTIQAKYLAEGKTKNVLVYSLIVALTNVILDYGYIFGNFGFPELGLRGAALASTLAEFLGMIYYLICFFREDTNTYTFLKISKKTINSIKENIKIGYPLLLQGFIALSVWTIFFMMIEKMGKEELTISLNIRHIYFIAFVPVWGFAGATKTYIAQYYGAKEYDKIPIIQRRIQMMCIGFLLLFFHGAIIYPEKLIYIINSDTSTIVRTAYILRLVFGAIIIYAFGSVYFQSISGIGRTKYTFIVEVVSTFMYIFSAYIFIIILKSQIEIVWFVEYIYFLSMGGLSILFLKKYNWKN